LAAFERTLISVLENQPAGCEVLVAHDGSYDDPFELCDEVRFVVARSAELIDLVSAATEEARGRFVHILADGIRATAGWIDAALEKFEHADAGSVAPLIRHAVSDRVLAAGWCDGSDRLCKQAHAPRDAVGPRANVPHSPPLIGAYLHASFWRRELLAVLSQELLGCPSGELAYTYEHAMRVAGWRCVVADECELQCDTATLPWETTSAGRGARLRAIRNHFSRGGWLRSISAAARAALANLARPKYLPESLGQALAPLVARQCDRQLRSILLPRRSDVQRAAAARAEQGRRTAA
jgi:hypothetical protein